MNPAGEGPSTVNLVETQAFHQVNDIPIESWGLFSQGKNDVFRTDSRKSISGKYGKSLAQVVPRGPTRRGVMAIPRSARKEKQ